MLNIDNLSAKVEKKAILIPPPGQPEQQYLANYREEKSIFSIADQNDFCLESSFLQSQKYSGFSHKLESKIKWMELFKIFEG